MFMSKRQKSWHKFYLRWKNSTDKAIAKNIRLVIPEDLKKKLAVK